MKISRIDLRPHFITNKQGKKIGVFFDITEYEKLLENIEDIYLGALATSIKKKEPEKGKSLEVVEKELKKRRSQKKAMRK